MSKPSSSDALIAAIIRTIPAKDATRLKPFVHAFYAATPAVDLERLSAKNACAIATHAYEFSAKRTKKGPAFRTYTPTSAKQGWQSTRLVLEILNDDMPFLVDSLTAELTRLGFRIYETIHPILHVARDSSGALKSVADAASSTHKAAESYIHFQLSPMPSGLNETSLFAHLRRVLAAVNSSVHDWQKMMSRARDVMSDLDRAYHTHDQSDVVEAKDFLRWLIDKNFVFLGCADYAISKPKGTLKPATETALGIYDADENYFETGAAHSRSSALIELTKSEHKSVVHRAVHMDQICVKRFDAKGNVVGETHFLGMFTSNVYYQSAEHIPLIRRKIVQAMEMAGFEHGGHSGKTLKAILEFYPRDELFQIGLDELFQFSMAILSLEARPGVGLFMRKDAYGRFVSCMAYVPRDRFNTYIREQIEKLLAQELGGSVSDFYTQITDSPLARTLIIVATPNGIPAYDVAKLEAKIRDLTNVWGDALLEVLIATHGEQTAEQYLRDFGKAFPKHYVNRFSATDAVGDITLIEQAAASGGFAVSLQQAEGAAHVRLCTREENIPLSHILPTLENLGCTVMDIEMYPVATQGALGTYTLRNCVVTMRHMKGSLTALKARFEEAMSLIWRKEVVDDGFNALIVIANLTARQIVMLRAVAHYLKQIGFSASPSFIATTLAAHPDMAASLVKYFEARFGVSVASNKRDALCADIAASITNYLDGVKNLSEDRVIRRYLELMQATLRTNYFQSQDGKPKSYLSFKFASGKVPELPLPKPYAEIFVYSMRSEGIHLRGDKVARGGLRWSDRHEDFRTEVLGLMKAQMVKNAVIVPQGSKGGFIVKQPPKDGGRDAFMAEGIACYQQFLSGLLDITDNIVGKNVVPPKDVVRHDGDDPYLVVAADKGTATFSDIANKVSRAYGFWLDDAFASGGSAGYDHKVMAITARGAWVCVERHFRELGIDTNTHGYTVVGIGDMSGDVFGNGLLHSDRIKLVAAFNHMHIFIDPTPDAKASFKERERLFKLPRSAWSDYNAKLISKGGGVFERSAKVIALSKEARTALGIEQDKLSPDQLISAILKAPVDLLWNGGIGTYVKASTESHEMVGDRTNNAVRVNGNELRCKIVGEGGNLGFTQRGRIEYARSGGRINTDSIDNSGGVDCSDHEVNIKIALRPTVASGKLPMPKRDALLASMKEEVAGLVLTDNRLQSQAITIAEKQGVMLLEPIARMMHSFERDGLLDRAVEFLPTQKQMGELRAAKLGLTRPELAILLSYSKLALYRDLKSAELLDDVYFERDLMRYFPSAMQKKFAGEIENHRLRREIIATAITNSMVNRAGLTFVHGVMEETGLPASDVARAYVMVRDIFSLRECWSAIEALDGTISADTQASMFADLVAFMERMVLWFLQQHSHIRDIGELVARYQQGVKSFRSHMDAMLSRTLENVYHELYAQLTDKKVPAPLARQIASLEMMSSACDVILVAHQQNLPVEKVGEMYFELGAELNLGWLRRSAMALLNDTYWDRLALKSIINQLYGQQLRVTSKIIKAQPKKQALSVEHWKKAEADNIRRFKHFVVDLKTQPQVSFPMLVVALRNAEIL